MRSFIIAIFENFQIAIFIIAEHVQMDTYDSEMRDLIIAISHQSQ